MKEREEYRLYDDCKCGKKKQRKSKRCAMCYRKKSKHGKSKLKNT